MERQAGLGRSLEDVLELVTPTEPDASASSRTIFEAEDLEQQLDQLMGDIRDLRERVQHLVGLVADDAVAGPRHRKKTEKSKKRKKAKGKKKSGK